MHFLFSKSVGRILFIGRCILACVLLGIGTAVLFRVLGESIEFSNRLLALLLSAPLTVPALFYLMRFAVYSRMDSIGLSPWPALFLFIPPLVLIVQVLKAQGLLPWSDLFIWNTASGAAALLFLAFLFVLTAAPEHATRSGITQSILRDIEEGEGQFLIRLVPLLITVVVIAGLYNFGPLNLGFSQFGGIYHGLNDAQSMDNAQLARQIARGEGYNTRFIRPYALTQLHNQAVEKGTWTGSAFPSDRFPADAPRILPDTYNAPGYPVVLAAWFKMLRVKFDQTVESMLTQRMYWPDRFIPLLNLVFILATAVLIFRLGLRLFDDRVAWLATACFLFSDLIWQFSLTALSTSFLMLLVTGVMLCVVEILCAGEVGDDEDAPPRHQTWLWVLALGGILGLACLTRLPLLIMLGPLLVFLFVVPRRSFFYGPVVAIIVVVMVAPWLWHEYKVSGNPFGSNVPLLLRGADQDYKGNQIFCTTSIPSYERWFKDLSKKEYSGYLWHFERAWDLLGSSPLILFFAISLMHRFKRLRAQAFLWFLVGSVPMLIFANNLGEAAPEPVGPWNLVVVLYPAMIVVGAAYFFVLLDRMHLQIWILNNLVVIGVVVLSAVPMVLTITTSPLQAFNSPPYMPPFIKLLGQMAHQDEWVTTDMPWATAWYADRGSLWLPDSITDFEDIHDTVCPTGVLMLTPVTWSQSISNLTVGEQKAWYPLLVGNAPAAFPLPAHTATPPGGPDYSVWSNSARWNK